MNTRDQSYHDMLYIRRPTFVAGDVPVLCVAGILRTSDPTRRT